MVSVTGGMISDIFGTDAADPMTYLQGHAGVNCKAERFFGFGDSSLPNWQTTGNAPDKILMKMYCSSCEAISTPNLSRR